MDETRHRLPFPGYGCVGVPEEGFAKINFMFCPYEPGGGTIYYFREIKMAEMLRIKTTIISF